MKGVIAVTRVQSTGCSNTTRPSLEDTSLCPGPNGKWEEDPVDGSLPSSYVSLESARTEDPESVMES